MGRVTVEITLANNQDAQMARRGVLDSAEVRRVSMRGVVDTGATHMVVPPQVVSQLGLPMGKDAVVRYADQRTAKRHVADRANASYDCDHHH